MRLAIDQPATFLRACLVGSSGSGAWRRPRPSILRVVRWATALWTVPLWIALILGLCRRKLWRWPQIAAPLAIAGLSLVHTLLLDRFRMRAPIVPAIALVAARP